MFLKYNVVTDTPQLCYFVKIISLLNESNMTTGRNFAFIFEFEGDERWITEDRGVKFGMEGEDKHTHIFRLNYCLPGDSYEYGETVENFILCLWNAT
jgi:hypothetical protein